MRIKKTLSEIKKGDRIRFEYGDYDNWVEWEVESVTQSVGHVGIEIRSTDGKVAYHLGTMDDPIEVVVDED